MEHATDFFKYEIMGITLATYLYSFLAVLGGFFGRWIVTAVIAKLLSAADRTKIKLDEIVLGALVKPAGWACVIAGVYVASIILPIPSEPVDIRRFVDALMRSVSVILVIWICIQLLDKAMDYWSQSAEKTDTKLDDQMVPIVRSSGKTFLIIIGVVLFLQNMGYSVTSLLAGLGLGGMAVALASQDTIANLFGSIVLFLDRPFQIGDWVEFSGVEGTVEEVGLRTTKIRTFANSLITTPNSIFTKTSINNWSRMKKRRIKMSIGVTYGTPPEKMEKAVAAIRNIVEEDENIRNDFYLVNFDTFGPYSLDIFVYCFTVTTNWAEFMDAKQEFMLKVMRAFQDLELEFAFPTQSIHLESMPGEPEAMTKQRPE